MSVTGAIDEAQENTPRLEVFELKWIFNCLSSAAVFVCLSSTALLGTTYYTAKSNGNDANPGTSSLPFKTIKKGVSVLRAGDTLFIRGGTYAEYVSSDQISFPAGTSWSSPVTISGYAGETVIMKPVNAPNVWNLKVNRIKYVIIKDLTCEGATDANVRIGGGASRIRLQRLVIRTAGHQGIHLTWSGTTTGSADYNEVVDCMIYGNGQRKDLDHGLYVETSYNLIEGNRFYSNAAYGIQVYNSKTGQFATGNTVRNNRFYSNARLGGSGGGIVLSGGGGNIAYNNFIWSDKWGITTYGEQKVYHNTAYKCAYGIWVKTGSAEIKNNIAYGNTRNIQNSATGVFSGNITVDPKFVDPQKFDLRLSSGSSAINAVSSIPEVIYDHFKTSRPQGTSNDVGAHEYSTSATPMDAPLNTLTAPTNLRIVSVVPGD